MEKISVLFICLGNICRSPMAEAVFRHLVAEQGLADQFEIASAGTGGWHVGEAPHVGTQQILTKNGIGVGGKRAMRVNLQDFKTYNYLIAMDAQNVTDVADRFGVKISRLLDFAPPGSPLDVPDPYYDNNFEEVYRLVLSGCKGLLEHILKQEKR
jgi:protein-tyrosine phosphatase